MRRYTPLRQKSGQQEEYDRLHRLLKVAVILQDDPRLDCSHIFPKSVYSKIRFDVDNCVIQCRTCHDWFGDHPEEGGEWIRTIIPTERYDRLLTKAMQSLQDTSPLDLGVWERYLKQTIQLYNRTPRISNSSRR